MWLVEEQQQVRQRTLAENAEVVGLWLRGLDRLGAAFGALEGHRFVEPEREHVLFALLAGALNQQYAGFSLATGGLYVPAMTLIRRCHEDWLAWWYVRTFPEHARLFLTTKEKTPDWNTMVQRLEAKFNRGPEQELRDFRHGVNPFSHTDRISVRMTLIEPPTDDGPTGIALGPTYEREKFDDVAGQFVSLLPSLIEAADVMCLLCGRPPADPDARQATYAELSTWMSKHYPADAASA